MIDSRVNHLNSHGQQYPQYSINIRWLFNYQKPEYQSVVVDSTRR